MKKLLIIINFVSGIPIKVEVRVRFDQYRCQFLLYHISDAHLNILIIAVSTTNIGVSIDDISIC